MLKEGGSKCCQRHILLILLLHLFGYIVVSFFILIVIYFVFVNSNCNGFATAKYNVNHKSKIKPQKLC